MKQDLYFGPTDWPGVLGEIKRRAREWEEEFRWPGSDLRGLEACGALGWTVPKEFGGADLPALEMHLK